MGQGQGSWLDIHAGCGVVRVLAIGDAWWLDCILKWCIIQVLITQCLLKLLFLFFALQVSSGGTMGVTTFLWELVFPHAPHYLCHMYLGDDCHR